MHFEKFESIQQPTMVPTKVRISINIRPFLIILVIVETSIHDSDDDCIHLLMKTTFLVSNCKRMLSNLVFLTISLLHRSYCFVRMEEYRQKKAIQVKYQRQMQINTIDAARRPFLVM